MSARSAEVLVLGGGPGGCAVAAGLARRGRQVVVLDRDAVPGASVGESLLPWCGPVLDELGVSMEGFTIKRGALFTGRGGQARFDFGGAWRTERPVAWQVTRDDFDARLRAAATRAGARFEEARVRSVEPEAGRVHTEQGDWEADFVVDATGRSAVVARQLKLMRPVPGLRNAALASHHRGVRLTEGHEPGDAVISGFQGGWFWFIPFTDGRFSVGVVLTPDGGIGGTADQRWTEALSRCPEAQVSLEAATRIGSLRGVSDFTAVAEVFHGERWALVGDAAMFLDPVFSSGVLFALESGSRLAAAMCAPERAAAMAAWEAEVRAASTPMLQAIQAWYSGDFMDLALSDPSIQPERVRRDILSLLAGDVFAPEHPEAGRTAARMALIAGYVRRLEGRGSR